MLLGINIKTLIIKPKRSHNSDEGELSPPNLGFPYRFQSIISQRRPNITDAIATGDRNQRCEY